MNREAAPKETGFEAWSGQRLRASAERLPADVSRRLGAARMKALERAGARPRTARPGSEAWLGGLALAGVAALAIWIAPGHEAPTSALSPEVALEVATLAEPELIEDLEFYAWLEANPLEEAG
jgi:ferric-dicitrate binding protein FerR (iron transport regulator)